MKHLLLTTIAAVVLVGCGTTQQSASPTEAQPAEPVAEAATPEPPSAEAPDISFFKAAVDGDYEAIKTAIDSGIDVNAKGGFFGRTALSSVAHLGHMKIAELLISRGAEVDVKDSFRATPLHRASREGHKNISELLINKNANVNAIDVYGGTPLDFAISSNHPEIADLLRKRGGKTKKELEAEGKPTEPVAEAAQPEPPTAKAPDISIREAARDGNIEAVKQHLAAGTDVNAKDWDWTPLHIAALNGRKEIAELLIVEGADVNAKDDGDETPLDFAIKGKHTKTADLLREHGGKQGYELKAEGK
jgi:ankyrin repeat protein